MSEIVLFHHIQGLTDGLRSFADTLRAAGHTVHTPDVFDGQTFDDFDAGVAHAQSVGFGTLSERAVAAAEPLGGEVVYLGFSLGVMPAQQLAQTRPGARGALLISGCVPVAEFSPSWPDGVPVQIHGEEQDPIFADDGDLDAARALVAATDQAELFLYPGTSHLFTDASLSSYDPAAADLATERILAFLARLD